MTADSTVPAVELRSKPLPYPKTPRQAEIRLHFAAFLREDQRQHGGGAEGPRHPRQDSRPARDFVSGERPVGLAIQLFPPCRVPILDNGKALEEAAPLGVVVGAGQLPVEPGGIAFVRLMLVPVGVHIPPSVLR